MESAIQTTDIVVVTRIRCHNGGYHHAVTTMHVLPSAVLMKEPKELIANNAANIPASCH